MSDDLRFRRLRAVRRAGRGVRRAVPPRRAAQPAGVHRPLPRAGRRDPRAVPGPGRGRAGRGATSRRRPRVRPAARPAAAGARWATTGSSARSAGAAWASSTRPSRSPSAAAWPEGPAPAGRPATARRWRGSAARRGRRPGCTTPTSCRSSRSARTARSATTPCSSSRARGSTWSSTSCGGLADRATGPVRRRRPPTARSRRHDGAVRRERPRSAGWPSRC